MHWNTTVVRSFLWLVSILASLSATPTFANGSDCENAALTAATDIGVPSSLLSQIASTESGWRGARGWPWTVNAGGKGHYFDTRDEAVRFAHAALQQGEASIDVGCFQINTHWHGQHFASLEAMFDPIRNAAYAAQFLSDLRRETGSWEVAVGYYHSRNEMRAHAYRDRVFAQDLPLDTPPRQAKPQSDTSRAAPWIGSSGAHRAKRSPGSLVSLPTLGSG